MNLQSEPKPGRRDPGGPLCRRMVPFQIRILSLPLFRPLDLPLHPPLLRPLGLPLHQFLEPSPA